MNIVISNSEDRDILNTDEVYKKTKGKWVTKALADAMNLDKGILTLNEEGEGTVELVTTETPLENPVMNFGEDENHKHHKKVHNTLVTQVEEEEALDLPAMNFEPK